MAYTGSSLTKMTARAVVDYLKNGKLTPSEAITESVRRINQVNHLVNSTVQICEQRARQDIINLEKRLKKSGKKAGWLAGMPILIKDLTEVSGVICSFGSLGFKDYVPSESDCLVRHMESRGALVLGKTNTPEMGAGGNTFNQVYGATRNPYDTRMNAGGSSGGAAVALATGQTWLAQGSDLAGSLRTPAGYCNVVGFRPSPGRAGGSEDVAFAFESVAGPMARNIGDTALFLDHMCGFITEAPITFEEPKQSFQSYLKRAKAPKLIAWSPTLNGFADIEPEINQILTGALKKLTPKVTIEEACPNLDGLYDTYIHLRGLVWAMGPGFAPAEDQKKYKKTLRENIEVGRNLTAQQIMQAQRTRTVIFQNMQKFLQKYDVLACPVVGLAPHPVEEEYPTHINGKRVETYIDWLRFSFLSPTTSLPSLSLPVGFTEQGMPIGIQLIGRPRGEAHLLVVAHYIEQVLGLNLNPIDPIIKHS